MYSLRISCRRDSFVGIGISIYSFFRSINTATLIEISLLATLQIFVPHEKKAVYQSQFGLLFVVGFPLEFLCVSQVVLCHFRVHGFAVCQLIVASFELCFVCACEMNIFRHTRLMQFFARFYFLPALILLTHIFSFHWIH